MPHWCSFLVGLAVGVALTAIAWWLWQVWPRNVQ